MQNKQALVPQLRFPEFKDYWNQTTFGSILSVKHGFAFKGEFFNSDGDYIVLTPGNFNEDGGFRYQGAKEKHYTSDDFPKEYILSENDLLVVMTEQAVGLIGTPLLVPQDGAFLHNQRLGLFETKSNASKAFLYHQCRTRASKIAFSNTSAGTKVRHTSPKKIEKLSITLPSLPEQEKIAAFLTSVDDRIDQLKRKKSLLQDYKKGAMQKLFSQELRFKDEQGKDFPDWEEKKVKDTFEIIPTKKFQILGSKISEEGQYPVVDQGKDLVAGFSDEKDKLFDKGEVIVFGDHTTHLKFIDFKFVVGADGTKLLRNKNENLRYLYYILTFNNVEQEGYKRHFSILKEVNLKIPSIPEQTKIANFLSTLDQKIEQVDTQITQTQTFKKGLLQQMFV